MGLLLRRGRWGEKAGVGGMDEGEVVRSYCGDVQDAGCLGGVGARKT